MGELLAANQIALKSLNKNADKNANENATETLANYSETPLLGRSIKNVSEILSPGITVSRERIFPPNGNVRADFRTIFRGVFTPIFAPIFALIFARVLANFGGRHPPFFPRREGLGGR